MSLYRVVCDGTDILDYSSKDMVLLAPTLELEINTSGSLEFVMPPYHKYYDIVQIMTSTIEVYENDEVIWYGRPVEQRIDFYKQKKIYCEGPLSFFNDTVQRPEEYDNLNLYYFFDSVLQRHNEQVYKADRTFLIGNFTIDDETIYRKLNYESTYDVLQNQCLNTNDGYFFFRRQYGINYIDWLKEMPYTCNQVIRFGLNLLNYSSNFDASEMATCVLPVGKVDSETDKALTIASVNGGSDILVSEAANTYGRIIKYQSWPNISDAFELMQEGRKYMENTQFNSLVIECSAADLHSKNAELENFRVGQMVHCLSEPHLVDRDFPISKMSLALDSAAKIITLGIMKRKTLTKIYKNDVDQIQSTIPDNYNPESYNPESYNPDVIEDGNGDEWEIIFPDEDGDPITAQRMPTSIRVARPPNKTDYEDGESIVWSGLVVQAMVNGEIWTHPPEYISGQILLSELSFSSNKVHLMPTVTSMEYTVVITWKYKGKEYKTSVKLNVSKNSEEYDIDGLKLYVAKNAHWDYKHNDRDYSDSDNAEVSGASDWLYASPAGVLYAVSDTPGVASRAQYQWSTSEHEGSIRHFDNERAHKFSDDPERYIYEAACGHHYYLDPSSSSETIEYWNISLPLSEVNDYEKIAKALFG